MGSPAPHLPPKVCNLKAHERRAMLPMFAFLIAIALFAGFTSALVTVAWIVPPFVTEPVFPWPGSIRGTNNILDPTVVNESKQRLISIFDSSKKMSDTIYPTQALVGYAALLSSDGWAVMADGSYRLGREKKLEGVDHQGIVHQVEKVISDPVARLVYLKFGGEGFRIVPFASWDVIDTGTVLWSFAGKSVPMRQTDWKQVTIGDPVALTDAVYPIWRPAYAYRLEPQLEAGSVVMNDRGALVGFVGDKGVLLGGWLIEGQLSNVLSSARLRYDQVHWEGRMIAGVTAGTNVKISPGFLVVKVSRSSANAVAKGDIIVRIGAHPVDAVSLAREILKSPSEFSVTVWRGGQEREVIVKKFR